MGGGSGADYSSGNYIHHQQQQPPPPPSAPYQFPSSYATAPPYPTAVTTTDYSSYSYPSYPHLTDPSCTRNPQFEYNNNTPQPFPQSYPFDHPPYPPPTVHQPYPNYPNLDPPYNASPLHDNLSRLYGSSENHGGPGLDFSDRPQLGDDRRFGRENDALDKGVYAYDGGNVEPSEARETSGKVWSGFDDYGRITGFPPEQSDSATKIASAAMKIEEQQDVKRCVQKFCVRMLPEGGSQGAMDVLCQIGLNGIHMLDPSTNRTLRIYPLETITRWEVNDPSTYTFWSKSNVDIEPKLIRLQSNSYTTNTILDTVTAATIQLKEMGGRNSVNSDSGKLSEQTTEKKKGIVDWMSIIRPGDEEKDHWVPDEAVSKCTACGADFGAFIRKHHCRNCGDIFCDKCTYGRIALTNDEQAQPVRVCDRCLAEVTQRLTNATEPSKTVEWNSHEDLAKKLQEEIDKNRKSSSGFSQAAPGGSGRRMKEVACPTCTVHLQVQVPDSGPETVECEVCQHPFLVSAN